MNNDAKRELLPGRLRRARRDLEMAETAQAQGKKDEVVYWVARVKRHLQDFAGFGDEVNELLVRAEALSQAVGSLEPVFEVNRPQGEGVWNEFARLLKEADALRELRTPQALAQAVAAYEQAIALGEQLDLSVSQYRNDLASAHTNKGNALQAIGTPQALEQAVVAHEKAIALGEQLDLSVSQYRNHLALAHMNRSNALLQMNNPEQALVDCEKAIDLTDSDELWVPRFDVASRAYLCKTLAHFRLSDPENAADAADDGLSLLRNLEANNVYVLRPLREKLFELTLQAYLAARQWQGNDAPDLGDEWLAPKVANFMTKPNCPLTLGEMIGVLNRALAHTQETSSKLQNLILAHLRRLPNPAVLFPVDLETRKRRNQQLESINLLRIHCAHPEPPPATKELWTMWNAVVDDDDAFFRYFGEAHLVPERAKS